MVYAVCDRKLMYCHRHCKGFSTPYWRPQLAGLQEFAKFPAGESVTPRGGTTNGVELVCRGGGLSISFIELLLVTVAKW